MKMTMRERKLVVLATLIIVLVGSMTLYFRTRQDRIPEMCPIDIEPEQEQEQEPPPPLIAGTTEAQAANLEKLAMVWGFTKYTHLAFITGQRCWDTELLALIPVVRFAEPSDVNDILFDWFVGLGESGYGQSGSAFFIAPVNELLGMELAVTDFHNAYVAEFANQRDWLSVLGVFQGPAANYVGLRICEYYLDELEPHNFSMIHGVRFKPLVFNYWLIDSDFLGDGLADVFLRFGGVPVMDISNAPVTFSAFWGTDFSNQDFHRNMDFADPNYRLLGLFRLWNALQYFFPYIDLIDDCWYELLYLHIPKMLGGEDMLSYELTLLSLASRIHDAGVHLISGQTYPWIDRMWGRYAAPARLSYAEGRLVVLECEQLQPGDVILAQGGVDIDEIIAELLQFVSFPTPEKAIAYLALRHIILRQHSPDVPMELTILRGNEEMTISVVTAQVPPARGGPLVHMGPDLRAYEILDGNIGLINPSSFDQVTAAHIMEQLAGTNGIIIDLRQQPTSSLVLDIAEYLVEETQPYLRMTVPSQFAPSVFIDLYARYSGGQREENQFFYSNEVVVLTDIQTLGARESMAMALQSGANVTSMGTTSMGSNGDTGLLRLPGDMSISFSITGVVTAQGEQVQRIGLVPDIVVERTIAGIRDGRDEQLEAAVEFLRR